MRKKIVLRPEQNGGQACRKVQQTYACNTNKCPGNQLTAGPIDFNLNISISVNTTMLQLQQNSDVLKL